MIARSANGFVANRTEDCVARGLGWFSVALGLTQLLAPRSLGRAIGLENHAGVMRLLGLRELATGAGLLTQPQPQFWLKARVAGDVMDLVLLSSALASSQTGRARLALATAGVAAVTRVDYQACRCFSDRPEADISAVRVTRSITIDRPVEVLFAFWRNFENLPRIMNHVESVRVLDNQRSHWQTRGPAGRSIEWNAEIINEHPNELIAWRSTADSEVQHAGSVRFSTAPGSRGTIVKVALEYHPPAGAFGVAVAKLFGESPGKQIAVDLRRFKQLMETGEIARTEGQPAGRRRSISFKYDQMVRT